MQQRYAQATDFWKERDFGDKISAAFEFLGAHWRPLGRCLVYFVLPATMLFGIGLGIFTTRLMAYSGLNSAARRMGGYGSYSPTDAFSFVGLGLAMLGALVAVVMLSATVYGYLRTRLYLPPGQAVTPQLVWRAIRARLGWVLLAVVVLGIGSFIGTFMLMGIIGMGLAAIGLGVWGSLLSVVLVMAPIAYVAVVLSLYFPVLWLESQGIFASIGRCFQLIKGQWWATFGLVVVVAFLQGALGFMFLIPQYAVLFGKALHVPFFDSEILGIITQCIYALGIVFTYSVPMLVLAFQYFNLVEQHEAVGSLLLLSQLGQEPAPAPALAADHYRPHDEGEY
ncbi:MAG TPA: hypothetical protein VFO93_04810 [Hymenobacter sp.]|uniref:hypothetical protein n=1 Tax=Hymenobacter sp. TaxID=1898978 RepID=UPI002D7FC398|nr:hypothetical protein [Hymenobacter sp.]HET9502837.1 hypothetical protein [Hymenobacter sp.]